MSRLLGEQELAADNLSLFALRLSSLYYIIAFHGRASWHLVFVEVLAVSEQFEYGANVQTGPLRQKNCDCIDERLYWETIFEGRLHHGGNRMDDEKETKVRFETLSAEKIPFGKNNFLEVARKKAITDEGDSEFISVSRGYFLPDGSEKYKKSITIPDDPTIKAFVTEKINKL
jgi:hypothetical protein